MAVLDLTTELLFQLLFVRFPDDIWEGIRPNLKITEFRLETSFTAIVTFSMQSDYLLFVNSLHPNAVSYAGILDAQMVNSFYQTLEWGLLFFPTIPTIFLSFCSILFAQNPPVSFYYIQKEAQALLPLDHRCSCKRLSHTSYPTLNIPSTAKLIACSKQLQGQLVQEGQLLNLLLCILSRTFTNLLNSNVPPSQASKCKEVSLFCGLLLYLFLSSPGLECA